MPKTTQIGDKIVQFFSFGDVFFVFKSSKEGTYTFVALGVTWLNKFD